MRTIKRTLLLFVFALLMISPNSLSMKDYLALAMENSDEVRMAKLNYDQKELEVRIARGGFLPQVALSLRGPDYSWNENYINFFGLPDRISLISETDNYSGALSFRQWLPFSGALVVNNDIRRNNSEYNLYNAIEEYNLSSNISLRFPILEEDPSRRAYRRKEQEFIIAKNDFQQAMRRIKRAAMSLYVAAQLSAVEDKISQEQLSNTQNLFEITSTTNAAGISSEMDLMDVEIMLMEKKIAAKGAAEKLRRDLKKMREYVNEEKVLDPDPGQTKLFSDLPEFSHFVKKAFENDNNSANMKITVSELNRELKFDKFRKYFSAYVALGYALDGRAEELADAFSDYKKSGWYGYLVVDLPVFDASIKKLQFKLKGELLKESEISLREYEKSFSSTLEEIYHLHRTLLQNLELLEKQVEKSAKLHEMTKLRYEAGLVSLEKMKEIQLSDESVRLSYSNTLFEINSNYLQIQFYMGE